jgi:hypothetical protein
MESPAVLWRRPWGYAKSGSFLANEFLFVVANVAIIHKKMM